MRESRQVFSVLQNAFAMVARNAAGFWCFNMFHYAQPHLMSPTCVLLLSDVTHFHGLPHTPFLEAVIRIARYNLEVQRCKKMPYV